jgi:hypothetical protein
MESGTHADRADDLLEVGLGKVARFLVALSCHGEVSLKIESLVCTLGGVSVDREGAG